MDEGVTSRRALLGTVGTVGLGALAGCLGFGDGGDDPTTTTTAPPGTTETSSTAPSTTTEPTSSSTTTEPATDPGVPAAVERAYEAALGQTARGEAFDRAKDTWLTRGLRDRQAFLDRVLAATADADSAAAVADWVLTPADRPDGAFLQDQGPPIGELDALLIALDAVIHHDRETAGVGYGLAAGANYPTLDWVEGFTDRPTLVVCDVHRGRVDQVDVVDDDGRYTGRWAAVATGGTGSGVRSRLAHDAGRAAADCSGDAEGFARVEIEHTSASLLVWDAETPTTVYPTASASRAIGDRLQADPAAVRETEVALTARALASDADSLLLDRAPGVGGGPYPSLSGLEVRPADGLDVTDYRNRYCT